VDWQAHDFSFRGMFGPDRDATVRDIVEAVRGAKPEAT
jgi:hypothetical protein